MKLQHIDTPAANSFRKRTLGGTSSRVEEIKVLWIGEHVALVHHAGGSYYDNGGRNYVSPSVTLTSLNYQSGHYNHDAINQKVHDCAKSKDGRLTKAKFEALVLKAKDIDWEYPERLRKKEEAEQNQQKQTRMRQALRRQEHNAAAHLLEVARWSHSMTGLREAANAYRSAYWAAREGEKP